MKILLLIIGLISCGAVYGQDVQCPFGEYRSINKSGQCVWNSIENLAHYNGETKLYNITNEDPRCQGGASPGSVVPVLNSYKIKFKQTTNRKEGLQLIKEAMADGRAALFSIPGHAMNVIHFDEDSNRVIYVNNNAPRSNQTITVDKFLTMWDGWVLVIYPDSYNKKIKPWVSHRKINAWYYAPDGIKYYGKNGAI